MRSTVNEALAAVTDEQLRAAARRIAPEFGLQLVVLFGSATRNRPYADDLDIGVLAKHPVDALAITNRFMEELRVSDIDIADLRRGDSLLQALVARDGVPLYEAAPSEFASFRSLAYRRFEDDKKFRDAEHEHIKRFIREHGGGE